MNDEDRHDVEAIRSSTVSLPTVAKPSLGRQIVTRGLSRIPASWTESTDGLLASVPLGDQRCSSVSLALTAVDGEPIASPDRNIPHKVYSIPIELAQQPTSHSDSQMTATTDDTLCQRSTESPRLEISDQDIEMDNLGSRSFRTESTDELGKPAGQKHCPPPIPREAPDYKPKPLRWPFQVLLLVIIAGVFAFFEYQLHNLPPTRYKMFHINEPHQERETAAKSAREEPSAAESRRASPHLPPSPAIRQPLIATQTATTGNAALIIGRGFQAASPTPAPDPRPPGSLYPSPVGLTSTYCGWAPPVWVLYPDLEYSSYTFGRGVGDPTSTKVRVEQNFPTFWSRNDSWCPCLVELEKVTNSYTWWTSSQWTGWPWTTGWATRWGGPDFWVYTHDEECRSVLSALSYWNLEGMYTIVPTSSLIIPVNIEALTTSLVVSEHPVSDLPWPWPVTDSEDQILLPFFVGPRTRGSDEDEFGNTEGSEKFYNAWASTEDGFSLMWWTLPFARYMSAAPTTAESAVAPETTTSAIQSSDTLSSSDRQTTDTGRIVETTVGTTSTVETKPSQSSFSSGKGISGGTSNGGGSEEGPTSSSTGTEEGTAAVPSTISKTGHTELSAPVKPTSSAVSPPHSVVGDRTTGQDGKEQSVTGPSTRPVTSLTQTLSSPPGLEDPLTATTTESPRSSQDVNFIVFPSSMHTTTSSISPPLTAKLGGIITVESSARSQPTMIMVTSSTLYSLHPYPGPGASLSSSNKTQLSTSLAKAPIFSFPSPTPTTMWPEERPPRSDNGTDTNQPPGPVPPGSAALFINLHTEADFLMASLVPVLLTTILAIATQVFTSTLNYMLPFRGLSHGGRLRDSLMLSRSTGIFMIPSVSARFLYRYRDPLPLLGGVLNLLSIVLVPISSEAIRLEISTSCRPRDHRRQGQESNLMVCAFGLRQSGIAMRLSEGILVTMAIVIIALGYLLWRWKTGVATEPWSIASMAALICDPELNEVIRSIPGSAVNGTTHLGDKEIRGFIGEGRRFRIGYQQQSGNGKLSAERGYGIYAIPPTGCDSSIQLTTRKPPERKATSPGHFRRWWHTIIHYTNDRIVRILAIVLTTGLLILILCYELSISPGTGFEEFMNSQGFGVRILFTAFGTATGWFWDEYFSQMSSNTIYQRLANCPKPARTSILLSSQPPDPFSAIYGSVIPTIDAPLLAIAVARLLAKFTPILFSGIPFRNTITFKMHEACTWMAIAILFFMLCVLLQGIMGPLRKSRSRKEKRGENNIHMPVEVDTIAGCMYYLAGSTMVKDFEGLSLMGKRERDRLICDMGKTYVFRKAGGVRPNESHGQVGSGQAEIEAKMRVDYLEAFRG